MYRRGPENGEETTSEACSPTASEAAQAEANLVRSGPSWKRIAVAAGGIVTAVSTAIITLVATHKSAHMANAAAYTHGLLDGAETARNGYDFDEVHD